MNKAEPDPYMVVRHGAFHGLQVLTGQKIEPFQLLGWKHGGKRTRTLGHCKNDKFWGAVGLDRPFTFRKTHGFHVIAKSMRKVRILDRRKREGFEEG